MSERRIGARVIGSTIQRYGSMGCLKLLKDYLFTKLYFSDARLVRTPVYIRGKQSINTGVGLTTGVGLRIDAFPQVKKEVVIVIGKNVQVNDYVHIAAVESVVIGDRVLIASKVFISDHNHGHYSGENQDDPRIPPASRKLFHKPVYIEDDVWIGEFVSILPGVTIGKGSIIGANSVVRTSIPEYSIAVGVPARVVKKYDFESSKWVKINLQ